MNVVLGMLLCCFISAYSFGQRLAGVDFQYIFQQQPISDKYDLSSLNLAFYTVSADVSYGWYLNKQKNNSLLFATVDFFKVEPQAIYADSAKISGFGSVPNYIFDLPDVAEVGLSLLYSYEFINRWELIANVSLVNSAGGHGFFNNEEYNVFSLLYFQKSYKILSVGLGASLYLSNSNVLPIPVVNLSYENKNFCVDLILPLSYEMSYKITDNLLIRNSVGLEFGGFSYHSNSLQPIQPDFVENTDLNITLGLDYQIYKNLFITISSGYIYREMIFTQNSTEFDKIKLSNGLLAKAGLFLGF